VAACDCTGQQVQLSINLTTNMRIGMAGAQCVRLCQIAPSASFGISQRGVADNQAQAPRGVAFNVCKP
jgi:hypothetical protein